MTNHEPFDLEKEVKKLFDDAEVARTDENAYLTIDELKKQAVDLCRRCYEEGFKKGKEYGQIPF